MHETQPAYKGVDSPSSVNGERCLNELNFALEEGLSVIAVYLEPT